MSKLFVLDYNNDLYYHEIFINTLKIVSFFIFVGTFAAILIDVIGI